MLQAKPSETDKLDQTIDVFSRIAGHFFWHLFRHIKRHPWVVLVSLIAIVFFLLSGHWQPAPQTLKAWEHILPTWSLVAIGCVIAANAGFAAWDEREYIPSSRMNFEDALKQAGLWENPKYLKPQIVRKKEHKHWLEWVVTPTVPVDVWKQDGVMYPFCAALGIEKFSRVFRDQKSNIHLVLSRGVFSQQELSPDLLKNVDSRSLALGMRPEGIFTIDLDKHPHLLIAGQTNAGKSVLTHHLMKQIIDKAWDTWLVDPKNGLDYGDLELHLIREVVPSAEEALSLLEELAQLHQERLSKMKSWGVTKWGDALAMGHTADPDQVLIVDEFAIFASDSKDKAKKEVAIRANTLIQNLALGARATGIHLIICTQYPTSELLGNQLRQQLTAIAGYLETETASKTVLGEPGAEQLPGQGRFLIRQSGGLVEFQGFLPPKTTQKDD